MCVCVHRHINIAGVYKYSESAFVVCAYTFFWDDYSASKEVHPWEVLTLLFQQSLVACSSLSRDGTM